MIMDLSYKLHLGVFGVSLCAMVTLRRAAEAAVFRRRGRVWHLFFEGGTWFSSPPKAGAWTFWCCS